MPFAFQGNAIDDLIESSEKTLNNSLPNTSLDDIETIVASNAALHEPATEENRGNTISEIATKDSHPESRDNTIIKKSASLSPDRDASELLGSVRELPSENPDELFSAAITQQSEVADKKRGAVKGVKVAKQLRHPPPTRNKEHQNSDNTDLPMGNPDELFVADVAEPETTNKKRNPRQKNTGVERATKVRQPSVGKHQPPTTTYDIFAQKIDLEDLLLDLGIEIPEQDKTQLGHLRKQKLESRTVAALGSSQHAAGQYILVPRITRFIYKDSVYNCTVKNLARTFIGLFADIKDLMQYKTLPFLDNEVPELGWGIIQAEAPRETLDKNYMEQAQYLRYISTTVGVPSHMVRRRTLVEAVYDIIAGRMNLDSPLQIKTLDWTATGPGKSDFICVFYSEQGLRLRHLNRTQRNKALGLCPNW